MRVGGNLGEEEVRVFAFLSSSSVPRGERGRVDVEAEGVDVDGLEAEEALGADSGFFLRLKREGVSEKKEAKTCFRSIDRRAKKKTNIPDARQHGARLLLHVAELRGEFRPCACFLFPSWERRGEMEGGRGKGRNRRSRSASANRSKADG